MSRARTFRPLLALLLVPCGSLALAQQGISRVGHQPAAVPILPAPVLAPPAAAPARAALQAPAPLSVPAPLTAPAAVMHPPMPTPLPGGPLPPNLAREVLERTAPLPPAGIIELRQEMQRRSDAARQPLDPVAKPARRFVTLDLTPGAAPEVIRTALAQGTVLTFVDAAGRPWPVSIADNFSPASFDTALFGANGVSIGVKSPTARTANVAVLLEGLNTPITFSVVTRQREVDYSVEVQVPRYLPGQPAPVGAVDQIRSLGAADLMDYLLNTPPRHARPLASDSPNVTAWQVSGERMVVRTEAMLASPAWQRRQSSSSGVNVYDLPLTSRLVLAAQGQMMSVRVSGFAATREQR